MASPTYLPIAVKAAGIEAGDMLPGFVAGRPSLTDALFLAKMYRRMAVGFLLMSGTPDAFFRHLSFSGRSFAHFLEMASVAQKATSRAEPFFDAIASNDMAGAASIAERSRRDWNPDLEYEDDFLYAHFLMEKFFRRADQATLSTIVQRYDAVLEGAEDFRLDFCRALLAEDQRGFDRAVEALVEAIETRLSEFRSKETLSPDEAATTAHVSTEILAWLRLAGGLGFKLQRNYPMAPELARMFARARLLSPNAWTTLPSYRDLE
jgi:hypothetical protein